VSRLVLRSLATLVLAGFGVIAAGLAATGSDDTWAPTGPLPRLDAPVFALAFDPADGRHVLAGTAAATVLRSVDAGASWQVVKAGLGRGVAVLAFDPTRPGGVLAGTWGAGVWRSGDGGLTWQQQPGTETRTVRAFAFVDGAVLAGGDQGVLGSRDGAPWAVLGLAQVRVSALAVSAGDGGPVVVAGGDAALGMDTLPLFTSVDAGQSWAPAPGVSGAGESGAAVAGSSMVTSLAAATSAEQPLLMGTNAGLFASPDRGATWQQLTGGGVLPGTDFTAVAHAPRHPNRLYVASDGGGSDRGGLWASRDGGAHFTALAPPEPEVTALAVSSDDHPELVVATFRPSDHAVALWTYRDAGGQPKSVAAGPSPVASPGAVAVPAPGAAPAGWRALLAQPETPYLAVGVAALVAVVAALAAYFRRGHQR
jgi:hypothetical protein